MKLKCSNVYRWLNLNQSKWENTETLLKLIKLTLGRNQTIIFKLQCPIKIIFYWQSLDYIKCNFDYLNSINRLVSVGQLHYWLKTCYMAFKQRLKG